MNSAGYTKGDTLLRIEHLHKRYGDVRAVRGLDLEVRSGEIMGLIGPDGAGKTSTMRIVCGLLLPDEGCAEVLGFNSSKQTRRIKHHIGYMPQRFSLYPDLSIAENLRFFADLYLVSGKERRQRERQIYGFSKLEPFKTRKAGALSGGMKQKLALGCTLIHTPDVLILDEPTTGVDPVSRQEFWGILRDLREQGLALLVSTPYMDEAELCDRVVLMHRGRSIARGTPDEITDTFDKHLLEVTGEDAVTAHRSFSDKPFDGVTSFRFGDSLHIVSVDDASVKRVRERLISYSVDVREIGATVEDAFVNLLLADEENTEEAA